MVCLGNMCVDTLHKGDNDDDDASNNINNSNNNNNNNDSDKQPAYMAVQIQLM